MKKWFEKLFSNDGDVSTKRVVMVLLVFVQIVAMFLLMYFKMEVANKDLVKGILENLFWLTLAFGGFVAAPDILSRMNLGQPKNIVHQDVQNQNVEIKKDE